MSRLFRRLSTLLLCSLLVLGVWLTQPLSVQAAEIRNKVDDKIAAVRRFQQYPGMYPTLAGKIVVGGPYDQVDDVLDLDLTERQKELFEKYKENFTVTDPEIALNEGFDRINDGQYR